jgi:hypothetical protein
MDNTEDIITLIVEDIKVPLHSQPFYDLTDIFTYTHNH